jgi:hypothetical protein
MAQHDSGTEGVGKHIDGIIDRVNDGRHVLELALDRVRPTVATPASATAMDDPKAEVRLQQRRKEGEVGVVARDARHQHQRRTLAAAHTRDARTVVGLDALDHHRVMFALYEGKNKVKPDDCLMRSR